MDRFYNTLFYKLFMLKSFSCHKMGNLLISNLQVIAFSPIKNTKHHHKTHCFIMMFFSPYLCVSVYQISHEPLHLRWPPQIMNYKKEHGLKLFADINEIQSKYFSKCPIVYSSLETKICLLNMAMLTNLFKTFVQKHTLACLSFF